MSKVSRVLRKTAIRFIRKIRPGRTFAKGLVVFVAFLLVIGGAGLSGYFIGQNQALKSVLPNNLNNTTQGVPSNVSLTGSDKSKADFSLFWKAWNIVDDNYFGTKDSTKRLNGAISGMVAGLGDPYTVYLPPADNAMFQSTLKGNFGGIGAELTVKNNQITIVSALEGTPAKKAGLQGQDVIIEIDGVKASTYGFNDAIDHIRGEVGTLVTLLIGRPGVEQPLKLTIVRDTIVVKSVSTNTVGVNKDIAYIKMNQFGADTVDLMKTAFTAAASSGKKGIVLDLRDNPGGYLEGANQIIGMVLPLTIDSSEAKLRQRTTVLERDNKGNETPLLATNSPIVDKLPMVVLVNGGSASASEIFSGAMKDYKRATVIGTKTFGKGSVQNLVDLGNGGSVKVTIAKWFTPLGTGIDGTGIEPDIKVELATDEVASLDDTQMKKALEVLATKM